MSNGPKQITASSVYQGHTPMGAPQAGPNRPFGMGPGAPGAPGANSYSQFQPQQFNPQQYGNHTIKPNPVRSQRLNTLNNAMMTTKPFTVSKSRSRTTFMANDRNHCGIWLKTNIKSQLTQLHRVGLHQCRHLDLYLMWLGLLKLTLCCAPCSYSDLFLADHQSARNI